MAPILRFLQPRSFLHIVSLRTATEFIIFTLALNKITGFYGILALFTGYHLNPLQLSHYIYSLLVLALVAYLHPAIRRRDEPLKNLALAWLYVLDTIANSVYTAFFGAGWFVLLAQHLNEPVGEPGVVLPGVGTINDTAGFTNPEVVASAVEIVATPVAGASAAQDAVAYATEGDAVGSLGGAVFQSGSMASLSVLALLWLIRIYFCIIVMAYARGVLRRYIATTTAASYTAPSAADDPTMAENPFRSGRAEGEGWRGSMGRIMLKLPSQRFWLGRDEQEEEWVKATSGRFESGRQGLRVKVPSENGVGERERRARSGTGPPLPGSGKEKSRL